MRCRPWRWLWGLLPLALIAFLTVIGERARVEQDLTVRSEQALQSAGFSWAKVRFEGRDGILEGTAAEAKDRQRALSDVRAVEGVRIVEDRTEVIVAISPYLWNAQRLDGQIVIRGFVPDAKTRTAIIGMAQVRFPQAKIDDRMVQGRGAPDTDTWTGGMSFALRQLAELKTGTVGLNDTRFSIEGAARSPQSYQRTTSALQTGLPQGISLGKRAITAPVVAPYEWSFDRLGNAMVLNGYVPDEDTRVRIMKRAKAQYPDAKLTDRMQVARGAPDEFTEMAMAAIEATAGLAEVRAAVSDTSLTLTGLAQTQEDANQSSRKIGERAGRFQIANQLRVLKVTPPAVEPFEWQARWDGNTIVLDGDVASDDMRANAVTAAREIYPGARIDDRMTVVPGAPDDDAWFKTITFGLEELAGLDTGEVRMDGLALSVKGEVETVGMSREARQALKNAPVGIDVAKIDISDGRRDLMAEVRERAAQAERKRQASLAAAREAERVRLAAIADEEEAQRQRQADKEAERKRLAAVAAAEEAEVERKQKAEAEEKERKRRAALATAEEAERRTEKARREALKRTYRLVAEYNGTPLELWRARRAASQGGSELSSADTASFDDQRTRSRGKLLLRGRVASQANRTAIVEDARNNFDGEVIDELKVLDGATDSAWLEGALTGLTQLSRLRNGALAVNKGELELYGDAVTADAAGAVRRDVDRFAPGHFDVSFLITAPKVLKKKEVEVALNTTAPVEAEQCGNLMNSLTSLAPIRFDVASAKIRSAAEPTLEKLTVVAQKCPRTKIRVSGHTDSNGGEDYNQELSEQRAAAVVTYLVKSGVALKRLTARGLGEMQPLVKNTTPEQRAKNRRIEFTVTDQ